MVRECYRRILPEQRTGPVLIFPKSGDEEHGRGSHLTEAMIDMEEDERAWKTQV